jgi:DNA-binding response OmpR family regulator
MPNMSGFEVLQRLNSAAVRTHTVRLSDRLGDRENELRGRQLGADDCVSNDRFGSIIEARASRAPSFSQNSSSSRIGRSEWRAARPRQTSRASSASPSDRRFSSRQRRIKLRAGTRTEAAIKAAASGDQALPGNSGRR